MTDFYPPLLINVQASTVDAAAAAAARYGDRVVVGLVARDFADPAAAPCATHRRSPPASSAPSNSASGPATCGTDN